MKKFIPLVSIVFLLAACSTTKTTIAPKVDPFTKATKGAIAKDGFIKTWWNDDKGRLMLSVDDVDKEFLYINYLAHGLGSNDIGLDRGQIGDSRIVKFVKAGDKLLLMQPNMKFRGSSSNEEEVASIKQAFASSVLWGFPILGKKGSGYLIDITDFIKRDAHGVSTRLKNNKQGNFKLDKTRSAIMPSDILNFPNNTEVEAIVTFTGEAKGSYLRSVVASNNEFSLKTHHSFVGLPDDNYTPRKFDPRSGFFAMDFYDYSSPIGEPLKKRYAPRHRLKKITPGPEKSKAVEPIIYYLDRGTPEPVKTALLEGAAWWNQAFEAAGYIDAFQIKMLPPDAHMLDSRYNVIQWVHRSTRGWSYGSTIQDPRTGEIIKGHVSLGSLRVRQDFLIAQGLVKAYREGKEVDEKLLEMSLMRLRQLSAHEVGHTLGLAHNFAASTDGRTSVMDYPYPFLQLNDQGQLDISAAYKDNVIGEWDKRSIMYGYSEFENEEEGLKKILEENRVLGLQFISDRDARPFSGAHPNAHLWDNGKDFIVELERILSVREKSMENFGLENLAPGLPLASLEEVLVPVYYAHRFQIEAVAKLIGGVHYEYSVKDQTYDNPSPVAAAVQENALSTLVKTLQSESLTIPQHILEMIPPKPLGYSRSRESFPSKTGPVLDPLAAAQGLVDQTFALVLNPERLNRIYLQQSSGASTLTIVNLVNAFWQNSAAGKTDPMNQLVRQRLVDHLLLAIKNNKLHDGPKAECLAAAQQILNSLNKANAQENFIAFKMNKFFEAPMKWESTPVVKMPDGSPIGTPACIHNH